MGDPAEENDPPPESLAIMRMQRRIVNLEVAKYRTFLMEKWTFLLRETPITFTYRGPVYWAAEQQKMTTPRRGWTGVFPGMPASQPPPSPPPARRGPGPGNRREKTK
jgi:hypothetical protein